MTMKEVHHENHLTHIPAFWDAMIALLMCAGLSTVILCFGWIATHQSSSPALRVSIGIIGCLALMGIFLTIWGSFIEPRKINVNKKSIRIKGLSDLTIAVIADLHVGPYIQKQYVERVVDRANMLNPDFIVLPGDFIYDHRADLSALSPLKNLRARFGVFAVLGNHDTGHMLLRTDRRYISYRTPDRSAEIVDQLEKMGMTVLRNEHRQFTKDGQTFALAGNDHCWMQSYDVSAAFSGIASGTPIVLLSHIPDAIMDKAVLRASLIISGHTHGGQIRLPFIGSLSPIPDQLGRAFDQGIFELENGSMLAITHGIGETMARARLFCPPEILLLELEAES